MKKWLVVLLFGLYVATICKATVAWTPALGGFGAFCVASVVVTSCVVGFGSLAIAVVIATYMHVKEALFRAGKVKRIGRKEKSND